MIHELYLEHAGHLREPFVHRCEPKYGHRLPPAVPVLELGRRRVHALLPSATRTAGTPENRRRCVVAAIQRQLADHYVFEALATFCRKLMHAMVAAAYSAVSGSSECRVFDVQLGRSELSLQRFLYELPGKEHPKIVCIDLSEIELISRRAYGFRIFQNYRLGSVRSADRSHPSILFIQDATCPRNLEKSREEPIRARYTRQTARDIYEKRGA